LIAVFIPMTSPLRFKSGPPLLPGLIAASVCRKSKYASPPPIGFSGTSFVVRPRAERMPADTVCVSPSGLPIATTQSPTATDSLSPSGMGSMPSGGSIFTTATSVVGSVPTIFPSTVLSLESTTSIAFPPDTT